MDQCKVGTFLRELRKGKNLSQEQLAERLHVSSRSISRWENGNTMPDISLIIELADFYDVDIRDLLSGERKSEKMNDDMKETLEMVADYTNAEKEKLKKELATMIISSATLFGILGMIIVFHLYRISSFFDTLAVFCVTVGLVYSVMSIIKLFQLNGRISKDAHRRIIKILLGIVISLFVLSWIVIAWAIGIF